MQEHVQFSYDGRSFLFIREKSFQRIAEDLRMKCLAALRPFAHEIERAQGTVHFEFDRGFTGARVRMNNLEVELQEGISKAIPSLSTL